MKVPPIRRVAKRNCSIFFLFFILAASRAIAMVNEEQMRTKVLIAVRGISSSWGAHELDIPLTAINTFVLICSSFTMAMALDAAKMKNKKKMLQFLLATLLIGGTFISIQAFEYLRLIE